MSNNKGIRQITRYFPITTSPSILLEKKVLETYSIDWKYQEII